MASQALGSKWGGLNPALLATLFPVNNQGYPEDGPFVVAPPTDGSIEVSANWQSPFEQSGAESKIPAITSMLQSGTLQSYAESALGKGSDGSMGARLSADVTEFSREGQGRSGMTKLNSTQVFSGAGPVKVTLTLHFRAFNDPENEVQAPIDRLARWALARELAPNGSIVSGIEQLKNGQGPLKALLPSRAPQMVGLRMGSRFMLAPMVIEAMSHPITGPRGADGSLLNVAVQLTLATLTALDQEDWTRMRSNQPTRLFNNN